MNRKVFVEAGLVVLLVGCAAAPSGLPTYEVQAKFDATVAKALVEDGPNTIKGNAFLRQTGGGIVTCAGQVVYLVPATAYAAERVRALYGNADRGVNAQRKDFRFVPNPPEYLTLVRTSRCDSQGNFVFEKVADGEFFAITLVAWQVANAPQGGQLMHRVAVKSGQTTALILSP